MAVNNAVESKYFSGQGIVLVSERKADGTPTGFRNVGNVSDLSISMETTTLEHKESSTGARATDLRLAIENKATVNITMESITGENLAEGLYGSSTSVVGGTVTDELTRASQGKTSATNAINITSVSVDRAASGGFVFASVIATDALTIDTDTYTCVSTGNDITAKEFDVGASDAEAISNLVTVINGQTATLTYEVKINSANPNRVDVYAVTPGVGGNSIATTTPDVTITPDGATLANGGAATVTTDYLVNSEAGSIFIVSGGNIPDDTNIHIDYTHPTYNRVDAFTSGQPERWLRFEGLNTARSNESVIIDIFRFAADPLAEQSLISDEIQNIVLTGSALADTNRPAGQSQFFREIILT